MECTLIEEILKDPKKRKEIPDITTTCTTTEQAIQKVFTQYHIIDDDGVGFV
jgi:hypothetical protein